MWRKMNPHVLLVEMQTSTATLENGMEIPQKVQIRLPYDPEIALLGIYPEVTKIQIQRDNLMFTAVLSTIAKLWEDPKCLPTDQ